MVIVEEPADLRTIAAHHDQVDEPLHDGPPGFGLARLGHYGGPVDHRMPGDRVGHPRLVRIPVLGDHAVSHPPQVQGDDRRGSEPVIGAMGDDKLTIHKQPYPLVPEAVGKTEHGLAQPVQTIPARARVLDVVRRPVAVDCGQVAPAEASAWPRRAD